MVLGRCSDIACCLLADWTCCLAICSHPRITIRVEASVVGRLVVGSTACGICLAVTPVAAADGDDRAELLPNPIALSAVEWLRQGYV